MSQEATEIFNLIAFLLLHRWIGQPMSSLSHVSLGCFLFVAAVLALKPEIITQQSSDGLSLEKDDNQSVLLLSSRPSYGTLMLLLLCEWIQHKSSKGDIREHSFSSRSFPAFDETLSVDVLGGGDTSVSPLPYCIRTLGEP